jgi:hypothetical protein
MNDIAHKFVNLLIELKRTNDPKRRREILLELLALEIGEHKTNKWGQEYTRFSDKSCVEAREIEPNVWGLPIFFDFEN